MNYRQEIKKINQPLHEYYKDKADLYLENGKAYKNAEEFKKIAPNQLRKILNQSKKCILKLNNKDADLESAKSMLFALLPMAAYNAGRDKKLIALYNFLLTNISKESIVDERDIECFDDLITSIIAYHKFIYDGKGGK